MNPLMNVDGWLTSKRLRAHGLLLGIAVWSVYIWTLSTPTLRDRNGNLKGTDFLHFYTLGTPALERRGGDLYDMNAQAALAARRVPNAAGIRYLPLYPPQVSILFAPFAHLSYAWALALWWVCTGSIYGLCCYRIWRACPNLHDYGGTVAILAAASPAFFHLIAWGQTSALALGCFTLAFFFLRDRREFLAGLVLGCLIFKPQLGLACAIVLVAVGAWKIIAGALLSSAAQILAAILYYGTGPLRVWIQTILNVRMQLPYFEPRVYQTYCLRTFWAMIIPWSGVSFALYLISAALILGLTIAVWRSSERDSLPLKYAVLLFATVLISPHLTVYDLVILAPAFLFLADWLLSGQVRGGRGMGTLLYLAYMLPLFVPLTRWTHVQLTVVVMVVLVWMIWKVARPARSSPLPQLAEQER